MRPSRAFGMPAARYRRAVDFGDAGRLAICADPSGAAFRLWQPGTLHGAQAVNAQAHGTSAS